MTATLAARTAICRPIAPINAAFPGLGNPVHQPNLNFAPQLGIAWDPTKNGKTVIRAGIGLFYENVIYNNVLFDRPLRLSTGAFNQVTSACLGGLPQPVPVNKATSSSGFIAPPPGFCGNDVYIGNDINQSLAFWNQVKAGNPLDLQAPNPSYIGNFLARARVRTRNSDYSPPTTRRRARCR